MTTIEVLSKLRVAMRRWSANAADLNSISPAKEYAASVRSYNRCADLITAEIKRLEGK